MHKVHLDWMRPWEEIKTVLKRHWIVYVFLFLYFFLGIWVTLTIYILWWNAWTNLTAVIFWMFFSIFLYIKWLDHELDMLIVTNNRIVCVEQVSFLNREVSQCNLWQVQEVWLNTKWILANILNFWTVKVQTAWNTSNFDMPYCPDPHHNTKIILNMADEYRDAHSVKWIKTELISS